MSECQGEVYSRFLLVGAPSSKMAACTGRAAIRVLSSLERTAPAFPCSRDLPETDALLSFIVIIHELDWSSFTSLQGYLR